MRVAKANGFKIRNEEQSFLLKQMGMTFLFFIHIQINRTENQKDFTYHRIDKWLVWSYRQMKMVRWQYMLYR